MAPPGLRCPLSGIAYLRRGRSSSPMGRRRPLWLTAEHLAPCHDGLSFFETASGATANGPMGLPTLLPPRLTNGADRHLFNVYLNLYRPLRSRLHFAGRCFGAVCHCTPFACVVRSARPCLASLCLGETLSGPWRAVAAIPTTCGGHGNSALCPGPRQRPQVHRLGHPVRQQRFGAEFLKTKVVGKNLTKSAWMPDKPNSASPIQVFFQIDTITHIRSADVSAPLHQPPANH